VKYIVDIDGTICNNTWGDYHEATPKRLRIAHLNRLYDEGHEIHYWTARGSATGKDWLGFTKNQLETWDVKYTSVSCGKPTYDVWIDDKAMSDKEYFRDTDNRI